MFLLIQIICMKSKVRKFDRFYLTGPIRCPTDLEKADIVQHEIKLSDDIPFKEAYRQAPAALFEEVRQHLKEMFEADAIRPSQNPFSSNVVLVRKKDGSLRFCIDFRKLNSRTIRDAYTLPRLDDPNVNKSFNTFVEVDQLMHIFQSEQRTLLV